MSVLSLLGRTGRAGSSPGVRVQTGPPLTCTMGIEQQFFPTTESSNTKFNLNTVNSRNFAKRTLTYPRFVPAKRLLGMMLALLVGIFATKAQESLLVYEGVTPSSGSNITSFDFVLRFDLSKIAESYGTGYGIGWIGYHKDKRPSNEKSVTIYKGDPSEGIVVGRCCDSNFNSSKDGFSASSEVVISIVGAIPEPDVTYTMVITNEFQVYKVGEAAKPLDNATFDCFTTPITYTFIGASASSEKLSITECTITANQVIDGLTDITFNFSQPVDINSGVFVEVLENDAIYAQSTNAVLSEDKMSVTYHFDKTPLLLNHSYVISLPKGAVSSASNASETNDGFNIPVVGNYVGLFTVKSSTPSSTEKAIFSKIEGIFDMPEGFQIYKKPEYALNLSAKLYEGEVAEANLVATLDGVYNDNRNGIIWTCNAVLKPDTEYILYKPEREFRAYEVATDKFTYEWYNGEVMLTLYTPSIEESGYPPIVLGDPVIGKHDAGGSVLKNGDAIGSIDLLEIAPVEIFYTGKDGESKFRLSEDTFKHTGYLYDITSGTPELIKGVSLNVVQRETSFYYYTVISAPLSSVFFEGHRYRFVIPKDEFTILYPPLYNYVRTPEYSIEFEGTTPTEARLVSSTLQDGEELSELGNVVWTFKGQFELNPEAEAILKYNNSSFAS